MNNWVKNIYIYFENRKKTKDKKHNGYGEENNERSSIPVNIFSVILPPKHCLSLYWQCSLYRQFRSQRLSPVELSLVKIIVDKIHDAHVDDWMNIKIKI